MSAFDEKLAEDGIAMLQRTAWRAKQSTLPAVVIWTGTAKGLAKFKRACARVAKKGRN